MRKVLAIVLAALTLGGCNNDHSKPIDEPGKIGFASQAPRSLVTSNADLQRQEIKLFGYYTLDSRTARVFDAERLYYDREIPGWDYAIPQYWISGASYRFYAISPYETPCTLAEVHDVVSVADYEGETEGDDLLYATATRDLSVAADFSTVLLNFHHACAALQFNLVNASNSTLTDVRNIRLVGLCNKGTLRVSSDGKAAWTLEMQTTVQPNASVQPFAGVCVLPEGGLPVNLTVEHSLYENGAILVLPQTVYKTAVTLHLEYKKASDVEYAVRDIQLGMLGGSTPTEWKAGEKYKYNLTLTDNTITTEVKVVDWIDNYVDL